ncbi:MAG: multiheme c-type cytochrome, partial [Maioricimonas sp. JB049]
MIRLGRFPAGNLVLAAVCVAGFLTWRHENPAAPVAADRVLQRRGLADESRCVECHVEAESFGETGHARTLSRASSPASLDLLRQFAASSQAAAENLTLETYAGGVRVVGKTGGVRRELDLDWCFGSGHHARTWVGLLKDSWGSTDQVEFRWSWYDAIDGFALTPGHPTDADGGYFATLGLLFDHPKTRRCFACHATSMSLHEGRLDTEAILPGVTCQRCHGPRADHVASEGEVRSTPLSSLDQQESVDRCAQCHRRADELETERIVPDNPELARFQPVGLTQSRCFTQSEMTCVTCHDPHLPLEAQDSLGIWQCIQCHDSAVADHTTCAAGQTTGCIRCHMPKVQGENPL